MLQDDGARKKILGTVAAVCGRGVALPAPIGERAGGCGSRFRIIWHLHSLAASLCAFRVEYWEAGLKLNPTLATAVGDYRYNDKLDDFSHIDADGLRKVADIVSNTLR